MSLTNIKTKSQGFTIVELLIVVVVIAILAAITIVSYNGITNKANASAAKSFAATFQKKAELYAADDTINRFPVTAAEIAADSSKAWYMPATGITYAASTSSLSQSNGKNTLVVRKCAATAQTAQTNVTASNVSGLEIYYYDYDAGAVVSQANAIKVGTTTSCPTS